MSYQLELYHYWRSSCSWRVRWALEYKGLEYKSFAIDLRTGEQSGPEYSKLNQEALVPTLVVDGEPMTQSMAILEWLEEAVPGNPLLPSAPRDRQIVRQLANIIAADTQPVQNLRLQKYVANEPSGRQEFARYWIDKGLSSYEMAILRHGASQFSFGASLTIADLCLIPQCYNAERFGVDLSRYPTIKRINEKCLSLASCLASSPSKQEGAS